MAERNRIGPRVPRDLAMARINELERDLRRGRGAPANPSGQTRRRATTRRAQLQRRLRQQRRMPRN